MRAILVACQHEQIRGAARRDDDDAEKTVSGRSLCSVRWPYFS
jgi:hypothetical protein